MRTINKVALLGNVGKAPELRSTAGGGTVASFSLATRFQLKDKNETVTEWHRIVAWGRTAEIVRDYVDKGLPLYVEGRLQTRSYEREGSTVYVTEVVMSDLSLLGNKAANASKSAWLNGCTGDSDNMEISDDDILL
jgi:single-strand DNA-binding protein